MTPAVNLEDLAQRASQQLHESGKARILITIAGIPGSGKSTLAYGVADKLNARGIRAVAIGMDGFHYTRAQLSAMDDPESAHKFRGAPFTFDAAGVVDLARQLAPDSPTKTVLPVIRCPTFDHKLKDPVSDGVEIAPDTQVVLFEGLYLHLREDPWGQIMDIADDTWFVHVDPKIARKRLSRRHVESGICATIEEGEARADFNDLPNGEYIISHSRPAACIVSSS